MLRPPSARSSAWHVMPPPPRSRTERARSSGCSASRASRARISSRTTLANPPTAAWGERAEAKPATTRETAREPAIARAAIGKLKPTEREAVVLHLVGGLDAAQIAEACGIELETARQRVARGVSQLVQEEKKR
jgi:DNA-directed RNA polymerase specialized sigma24 family protein